MAAGKRTLSAAFIFSRLKLSSVFYVTPKMINVFIFQLENNTNKTKARCVTCVCFGLYVCKYLKLHV